MESQPQNPEFRSTPELSPMQYIQEVPQSHELAQFLTVIQLTLQLLQNEFSFQKKIHQGSILLQLECEQSYLQMLLYG